MSDQHECQACGEVFSSKMTRVGHQQHCDEVAPWQDKKQLEQMLIEQSLTIAEVADQWGCSRTIISRWKRHHEIQGGTTCPDCGEQFKTTRLMKTHLKSVCRSGRPWQNPDVLKRLYVEQEMTCSEIGDKLGCSDVTVGNWIDQYDINLRKPGDRQRIRTPQDIRDEDQLREDYLKHG